MQLWWLNNLEVPAAIASSNNLFPPFSLLFFNFFPSLVFHMKAMVFHARCQAVVGCGFT